MAIAEQKSLPLGTPQSLGGRLRMVLETAAFVSFGLTHPREVPRVPLRRREGGGSGKQWPRR